SAAYFLSQGDNVIITDIRNRDSLGESIDFLENMGAVIHCGGYRTDDFTWSDLVLKDSAIRLDNEFLAYAKRVENDITYVSSRPEAKNIKIICVTGSKNKTTTACAINHCLNKMGASSHFCGNLGLSAFSEIQNWANGDIPQYAILELSAWKARDIYTFMKGKVPHIEVSVITSVFDQSPSATTEGFDVGEFNHHANHIVCPSDIKEKISKLAAKKAKNISSIESSSRSMAKSIPPKMAATFAVLKKLGFSTSQINNAIKSFRGIPNRNEFVLRTENALYINDSSSIIPSSLNMAMENFTNLPVHLICGGSDSSLDAEEMLKSLKNAASLHLLEGSFTQKKLIPLLKKKKIRYNGPYKQIEEAVSSASSRLDPESKTLQIVLLSPGAPAYELFLNEYRLGQSFNEVVNQLPH
ncbi:MAG: UDP-N-acetylmuramoylalanine--D-glutamate ligase, partial [Sphaerochaetaceae bacterium]|nr:UDP-N-acetylmuramoylalanine--D-glutamate ligase [Sphaerochaetaceae bacterium]